MRIIQILIVSVVKICEQCLQTASASRDPYGRALASGLVNPLDLAVAPGQSWGYGSWTFLGYNRQMKIPSIATDDNVDKMDHIWVVVRTDVLCEYVTVQKLTSRH